MVKSVDFLVNTYKTLLHNMSRDKWIKTRYDSFDNELWKNENILFQDICLFVDS